MKNVNQLLFEASPEHDPGCKVLIRTPASWAVETHFCGPGKCYRTKLIHVWDRTRPLRLYGLMNPSGATDDVLDMTVNKTAEMARIAGFGGQMIANAIPWRARNPKDLKDVKEPWCLENDEHIYEMGMRADQIVLGYGNSLREVGLQHYCDRMTEILRSTGKELHVLGLSRHGVPIHPMALGKAYVAVTRQVVPWKRD